MQAIIKDRETVFAELVRRKEDLFKVFKGIERAIATSLQQDKERHPLAFVITDAGVRDRFKICEKWFRIMRGDCGYSVDRAVDFLPTALRTELDGGAFEPPKADQAWSPDVLMRG